MGGVCDDASSRASARALRLGRWESDVLGAKARCVVIW